MSDRVSTSRRMAEPVADREVVIRDRVVQQLQRVHQFDVLVAVTRRRHAICDQSPPPMDLDFGCRQDQQISDLVAVDDVQGLFGGLRGLANGFELALERGKLASRARDIGFLG